MKNLVVVLIALLAVFVGTVPAQEKSAPPPPAAQQTSGDLISLLPASDAAVTVNMKRLLNDALPQFAASNPKMASDVNKMIEDVKAQTGIDLRSFEQVAVGMRFKRVRPTEIDVEPIAFLRGSFNSNALIAVGKIAANGKFRQEKIADKTVMIFTLPSSPKAAPQTGKTAPAQHPVDNVIDKVFGGELAVVATDANTLAFGKPNEVRSMLTANSRLSADLSGLLNRNQAAVMSFAGNMPSGSAAIFGAQGNDQIANIVNSIRQLSGAVDVGDGSATLMLNAGTEQPAQAEELESTLVGLKELGGVFLGGKKDEKSQIIIRLIEALKITRSANEVQLQVTAPQSDIDKLIKGL